jgi:asparagine synthase (glutamine-hydrolysing)
LANFVIVVDPDPSRRAEFVRTIEPKLAIVRGLERGSCCQGDCSVVWAAAPGVPISCIADAGGLAVLWGDATSERERVDSFALRGSWKSIQDSLPQPYDGFYAGAVFDCERGLTVGADLLGLFPVYYWAAGDVVIVGSSPDLFRQHAAFRPAFNPAGLAGILLTNGLVDGQTLEKSVRRLSAGHLLRWVAGKSPRELCQYEVPRLTPNSGVSFQAHLENFDNALRSAIKRHVRSGKRHGLLLSGGLDSRLLSGYLAETGVEVQAFTWGLPTDIEMHCAQAVARTLGFPHRHFEPSPEGFVRGAKIQADYEHLANGFNQIRLWDIVPHLAGLGAQSVTGLVLDSAIKPYGTGRSEPSADPLDRSVARQNERGIPAEILRNLLRREVFGDVLLDVLAQLRRKYASAGLSDFRRAWLFGLGHRGRFHVGSAAHRFSFGTWPVLAALDRKVLEVLAAMPAESLEDRLIERELLAHRFPELAALPLDRGSDHPMPLKPKLRHLVAERMRERLSPLRRLVPLPRTERRYWHRTTDLDGPGWLLVRQAAEPHRERIYALFRQDVFDTVVPSPLVPFQRVKSAVGASGVKLLLGSMLWAEKHL